METHDQNGNGYNSTVYLHRIHDELVIMIGTNGTRPSSREDLIQPQRVVGEPKSFLDDLIRRLPTGAVIPAHPSTPDVLYAGSSIRGYVMAIDPKYEQYLKEALIPNT